MCTRGFSCLRKKQPGIFTNLHLTLKFLHVMKKRMARKQSRARTVARSTFQAVGEGVGMLADSATANAMYRVKEETRSLLDMFEHRMLDFRGRFMRLTFASLLIGIGSLLLFVALLMYLVDFFGINWATAFLIVGALMLIIAFVMRR